MQSSTMTTDVKIKTQAELNKEFYESLPEKDKIIHDLAVKMLNTRYTPERSNAYLAWSKSKK
jgi:hypothetical protein